MDYKKSIEQILKKQDGIILSNDLTQNKIPRYYLSRMVESGDLEKADRGVYVTPDTWEDSMFILQARYPKIVFSHETALFLHLMTDRTPSQLSITIPMGYSTKTLIDKNLIIRNVVKSIYKIGIMEKETSFGRKVRTYDVERTLCDIVKESSKCDIQIINPAFRQYINSGKYNLHKLNKYAKALKVEKNIQKYLSVLL